MKSNTEQCNQNIDGVDIDIHCALEEYKILWDYYKETLEERRTLFEWYFKIVALPAAAIGVLFSQSFDKKIYGLAINNVIGFVLTIIFFSGLSLYATYTFESVNATKYFMQIVRIRKFFRNISSKLEEVFYVGNNDNHKTDTNGFDFIKIFKGMTIPIINSAIGLGAIISLATICSVLKIVAIYIVLLIIHIIIYILIFKKTKME